MIFRKDEVIEGSRPKLVKTSAVTSRITEAITEEFSYYREAEEEDVMNLFTAERIIVGMRQLLIDVRTNK